MIEYNLLFIILGYIGSSIIGIMLIPQVYLTIKTNKTDDLSVIFLIMNMIAVVTMIPYSIYFQLYPVLIANSSVGICNSILLCYTIKNQNSKNKIQNSEIETETNIEAHICSIQQNKTIIPQQILPCNSN